MWRNPGMLWPEFGQRGGDRGSAQSSVDPGRSSEAPGRAPSTAARTTAVAETVPPVLRGTSGPSSGRLSRRRCTRPERRAGRP